MTTEKKYWLDEPRNVNKIVYTVYLVCILALAVDLLYAKGTHFKIEEFFGFYSVFGFVACVALVLAAWILRLVVRREEDYYD